MKVKQVTLEPEIFQDNSGGRINLVDFRTRWTQEELETIKLKKEFESANGLLFLIVGKIIVGAASLTLSDENVGFNLNSYELAVFVRHEDEWQLVEHGDIILSSPEEAGTLSDDIVRTIKSLELTVRPQSARNSFDCGMIPESEVHTLIKSVGVRLGYDHFGGVTYPEDRLDICAAKWTTEDGRTYGYDTIYLVWKDEDGRLRYREIANSKSTKDYIHVSEVAMNGDKVVVKFGSGGSYSGTPWEREITSSCS